MATETGLRVENVNLLLRTLNAMGREASERVRLASTDLAGDVIRDVSKRAHGNEAIAMAAFRVYRDRIPKIGFPGGAPIAVSGRPTAGQFFYGTEFGGQRSPRTQQFRPNRGQQGYFFYPSFRTLGHSWAHAWFQNVMDVVDREWAAGARKSRR